jgi:hypothetical protein
MQQIPEKEKKRLHDITTKQFLFGDFDKDGAKNVDDPKPFDKSVKRYPKHTNKHYYHRARYGDGEREVLLSTELRYIEKYNNKKAPFLETFLHSNPGATGRIKTVPSTMKKLRSYHAEKNSSNLDNLHDISGALILTNNRKEAAAKNAEMKKKYVVDPKQTNDFYAHPKDGVYYAYHLGVVGRHPKRGLELQMTSKPMHALAIRAHKAYKQEQSLRRFIKPARKLYEEGY